MTAKPLSMFTQPNTVECVWMDLNVSVSVCFSKLFSFCACVCGSTATEFRRMGVVLQPIGKVGPTVCPRFRNGTLEAGLFLTELTNQSAGQDSRGATSNVGQDCRRPVPVWTLQAKHSTTFSAWRGATSYPHTAGVSDIPRSVHECSDASPPRQTRTMCGALFLPLSLSTCL